MTATVRTPSEPTAAAARQASPWVLHIVPPNGGGVDRWIRDALSVRPDDSVLHVSDRQWVLELPGHRFFPLNPTDEQQVAAAIGRPSCIHLHSLQGPVMHAALGLRGWFGADVGITVHDVGFATPDALQAQRITLLREAKWLVVPTRFMRDTLEAWWGRCADGQRLPPLHVIPNGWRPLQPSSLSPRVSAHDRYEVAMVGAIGAHKGLAFANAVAKALPDGVRIVLIGYAEGALTPGWLVPDRLWVHGVFQPEALEELLSTYGARVVWFAPGVPESFCYALSDVWQAGWPAIVPDIGALGERMRAQGFGCTYDPSLSVEGVATLLTDWLKDPPYQPRQDRPVEREPSLAETMEQFGVLYTERSQAMQESIFPDENQLQRLAQQHLDSAFFRKEILRLQEELMLSRERVKAQEDRNSALLQELQRLATLYEARGNWILKLEADIESLQRSLANCPTVESPKGLGHRVREMLNRVLRKNGVSTDD